MGPLTEPQNGRFGAATLEKKMVRKIHTHRLAESRTQIDGLLRESWFLIGDTSVIFQYKLKLLTLKTMTDRI